MKLYLWENLDKVSTSYHSGGGLVVVAEDDDAMRRIVAEHEYVSLNETIRHYVQPTEEKQGHWVDDGEREVAPKVFELTGEYPEEAFIFPDAGCC